MEAIVSNPQNEAIVRRLLGYLSDPGASTAEADQLIDPGWTALNSPFAPSTKGPEGFRELHDMFSHGFSDFKMHVDQMISDGDWVSCYYTMEGKHTGDLMGMPATGKSFTMPAIGMFRFRNGKAVEARVMPDRLSMLQQVGIVQMPGQRRAA